VRDTRPVGEEIGELATQQAAPAEVEHGAGDESLEAVVRGRVSTATAYPNSGKIGAWTGDPAEDLVVRRASKVESFEGERRRDSNSRSSAWQLSGGR
jgi:hypothetical protein